MILPSLVLLPLCESLFIAVQPRCAKWVFLVNYPTDFQSTMRIGIGHDTHRLGMGGPLWLGGIAVPHEKHAIGHSDADVLLHSITDALLGALALGDIGEMFPDSDPANQGRDSADMLLLAYNRVLALGYEIANLDCIVFAQTPKLSAYKLLIRQRIATILGITPEQVSVKAKTGELVGPVGREEAVMAESIVLLMKISEGNGRNDQ